MKPRERLRFRVVRDDEGSFKGWTAMVFTDRFDATYGEWEQYELHYGALFAKKIDAATELRGARAAHALATGLAALES